MSNGDEIDDEPTNPGRGGPLVNALRDLRLALYAVGQDIDETTRTIEKLAGAKRFHQIIALSEKMGVLGDLGHDLRRALRAIAEEGQYETIEYGNPVPKRIEKEKTDKTNKQNEKEQKE